jgi:hypothetical protein
LLAARRGGSDPNRYGAPSASEREAMAALMAKLLAADSGERSALSSESAGFGFRVDEVGAMPGVWLLREAEAARRGGGAYLVRPGAPSQLVVQAAHTFFDEGTLALGCELFTRATAAALFVDTAHRYKAADIDAAGNYPADVAHAPESLFQSATEGLLRTVPHSTVVQLHGFAARESRPALVLSNGSRRAGALETRVQELLAPIVPGRIERFPEQTAELGGTTNVQGALVRARGGRFLHVEIESELRSKLSADSELRARFLTALAGSVSIP